MYVFNAALYCDDCGPIIRERIRAEGGGPPDLPDGCTDTDSWPEYADEGSSEADSVNHCDSGDGCPGALTFAGHTIGALIGEGLTSEGVDWLRETLVAEPSGAYQAALYEHWRRELSAYLDSEPDADDYWQTPDGPDMPQTFDLRSYNAARLRAGLGPVDAAPTPAPLD